MKFAREKMPAYKWADNLSHIVPTDSYRLCIDLTDFNANNLSSINFFLKVLSSQEDLKCQAINIMGGTSFKFNKIKDGTERLFEQGPVQELLYFHTGKQAPASPAKTIGKWAEKYGGVFFQNEQGCFHITKGPDGKTNSDANAAAASFDPFDELGKAINNLEITDEKEHLVTSWKEQKFDRDFCFPEEIGPEKILDLYIDDLPAISEKVSFPSTPYLYMQLSGAHDPDVPAIVAACQKNEHIRYVNIVCSSISIEALPPLFEILETGKVWLINIHSALRCVDEAEIYQELKNFLENNEKTSLLSRFVWLENDVTFPTLQLADDVKKSHQEFWLVNQSVELCKKLSPDA